MNGDENNLAPEIQFEREEKQLNRLQIISRALY